MKPLMYVPPAQAEALYDTQDYATQDALRDDLCPDDRLTRLPWRDEESSEELLSYTLTPPVRNEPLNRRTCSA